ARHAAPRFRRSGTRAATGRLEDVGQRIAVHAARPVVRGPRRQPYTSPCSTHPCAGSRLRPNRHRRLHPQRSRRRRGHPRLAAQERSEDKIMADSVIPPITPSITAATNTAATNANSSTSSTGVDKNTIAGNFQTFLTLLTTQLKNQNPLDPL